MANMILKNGRIHTMDSERSIAECIVISNGRIIFTGPDSEYPGYITDDTEIIDLNGKMVLPGFIDAHAHPIMAAFVASGMLFEIDQDRDSVLNDVRNYVSENPGKQIYFGQGYNEAAFNSEGPVGRILDEICSDKPIHLQSAGGHEAWCNSKALEIAGINKDTIDPIPGFQYFERDADGRPNGHLIETEPGSIVMDAIKPFDEMIDEIQLSIKTILTSFNTIGITSTADCGSFGEMPVIGNATFEKLLSENELTVRIMGCYFITMRREADEAVEKLKELHEKYNSDMFNINTLKIINDGTIESHSASFFEPYTDTIASAEPLIFGEDLKNLCLKAAEEGFDIYIHAIGDRSIHETLTAGEHVRENGHEDTRITNAHTVYIKPEDRALFGKFNIIANTTSVWHQYDEHNFAALGERANEMYTMNTLKKNGAVITLGSDFPVDEFGNEPLKGIEMAATRQMYGKPDNPVLEPAFEKLSVMEAIECYTRNAAYQLHMEDKIGSLEAGKYADIVVLEKDIFNADVYDIHKIDVSMTISNGQVVYKKQEK